MTVCLLKKKRKKDNLNEKIKITSNQEPTNDDSNIIKANYKKILRKFPLKQEWPRARDSSYFHIFTCRRVGIKPLEKPKIPIKSNR